MSIEHSSVAPTSVNRSMPSRKEDSELLSRREGSSSSGRSRSHRSSRRRSSNGRSSRSDGDENDCRRSSRRRRESRVTEQETSSVNEVYSSRRDEENLHYGQDEVSRFGEESSLDEAEDDQIMSAQYDDDEDMQLLPSDSDYDSELEYRRRAPALTPGAVAVVRRGFEENFEDEEAWDPTAPQPNDYHEFPAYQRTIRTYIDAAVTPIKDMSRTWKILLSSAVVLIIVISVIVIVVTVTGKEDPFVPTQISLENLCDFNNTLQPNPVLQCECNGDITVLTDEVRSKYDVLRTTFIPSIFPQGLDFPIDSCEPQNAALLWLATDIQDRPTESMRNRYLLSLLFSYWDGLGWKERNGWLTTDSECKWTGINCTDDIVSQIDLLGNDLDGEMVTELGLFKDLHSLYLEMNNLSGTLPAEIASATLLEHLALDGNGIGGTIPPEIINLVNLKELSLEANALTGSIPLELIELTNLEVLELSDNILTGFIPSEIGLLKELVYLGTARNALRGQIPSTIGFLTKLETLLSPENEHTGTIPKEVYDLTTLKSLILGFNKFKSSRLPNTIVQLTNLDSFMIPGMGLAGTIPSELGSLTNLKILYLFSNELTGTIPTEIGNLEKAEKIALHFNRLDGTMPEQVCHLADEHALTTLTVSCGLSSGPECDCCVDCTDM